MYAEVKNGVLVTWPYNYDTLCKANPYTKFPADKDLLSLYSGTEANLAGHDLVNVIDLPQPPYDGATQIATVNIHPNLSDGEWVLGWTISDLTAEQQLAVKELKSGSIRAERNRRLKDSDWTQVADAPVDKAAWSDYRQALRDITQQAGFPWNVTWPTKPQ